MTSWPEQRNGGRDSTPSMGVIVAGIVRRRVGRLSNATMRAWAPRQKRGRRNLPSFGVAGCSYFDAPGPGWVRWNRACEALVPKSARDACSVVVASVAIGLLGRAPTLRVGYSLHGLWEPLHEFQAHGAYSAFEPGQLTAIPLAYGVCCVQPSTCAWRRIFVRDIPSGLLRGRRFHSEDGYMIGSR